MVGRMASVVPTSRYCTTWSRTPASVGSERNTCTNGRWLPTRIFASRLFCASSSGRDSTLTSPRVASADSATSVLMAPPRARRSRNDDVLASAPPSDPCVRVASSGAFTKAPVTFTSRSRDCRTSATSTSMRTCSGRRSMATIASCSTAQSAGSARTSSALVVSSGTTCTGPFSSARMPASPPAACVTAAAPRWVVSGARMLSRSACSVAASLAARTCFSRYT